MSRRVERLLLVSSSGGVLLDLMALRPWWEQYQVRWVAVPAPDTREVLADQRVTWVEELSPGRPVALAAAVRAARADLAATDTDLVVSAGTGVAVPYFMAARLGGTRTWWVETLNVLGRPGLAARACARLASCVVVQHPELLACHRHAVNVGELY